MADNQLQSGTVRQVYTPQPTLILMPKGETGKSRSNVADRQKHPRLRGADLYVMRLGWDKGEKKRNTKPRRSPPAMRQDNAEIDLVSYVSSLPSATSGGSLHDELRDPSPRPQPRTAPASDESPACSAVHASRPCYRCVLYIHAVGIKRVFWTNDAGEWEGQKVAKLAQALESIGDGTDEGGPLGNGVFVTKHEVFMLKRMVG